jgi:putative ATPase
LDRAEGLVERTLPLTPEARDALIATADGDGRFLLNQAETLFSVDLKDRLDPAALSALLHRRVAVYDKDREGHYNLISALHKSIRGSDPQAALYYLARMLSAGRSRCSCCAGSPERRSRISGSPTRRRWSSAWRPRTPTISRQSGRRTRDRPGLPLSCDRTQIERGLPSAEKRLAGGQGDGSLMPPPTILNAPTKLMKSAGYGKGYQYDHDLPDAFSGANYWPEEIEPQRFYEPTERGLEKRIAERLAWWEQRRAELGS